MKHKLFFTRARLLSYHDIKVAKGIMNRSAVQPSRDKFTYSLQNKEGDTISVADLTDLPSDSDFVSLGPEIAAIEGEIDEDDNPIIRDMKAQCSRDQGQDSTEKSWL